jgi:hypothetical protein
MTPLSVSVAAAIAAVGLLIVVFELIRSRRLQERYALLWIATALVTLPLALWRDALDELADLAGVSYPPSLLFMIVSFFIVLLLLHYSTVISQLSEQNVTLAQRLALLEHRLAEREGRPGS